MKENSFSKKEGKNLEDLVFWFLTTYWSEHYIVCVYFSEAFASGESSEEEEDTKAKVGF
jgi:hypothetical protein